MYRISLFSILMLFAISVAFAQHAPEGSAVVVIDESAATKLSPEDFALLTDVFNTGQIKPLYVLRGTTDEQSKAILGKLESTTLLYESTRDESAIPQQYAWTNARVFIKTFYTELILRDIPNDAASRSKMKKLLGNCSNSSFLDNSYPLPKSINSIGIRADKLELYLSDYDGLTFSVYKLPNINFMMKSPDVFNEFINAFAPEKQQLANSLGLDKPRFLAQLADPDNHAFSFFSEMTDSVGSNGEFLNGVYEFSYELMMPLAPRKYYLPAGASTANGLKAERIDDSLNLLAYESGESVCLTLFDRFTGRQASTPTIINNAGSIRDCNIVRISKDNFLMYNTQTGLFANLGAKNRKILIVPNDSIKTIVDDAVRYCTAGMENSQNTVRTSIFFGNGLPIITNSVSHDGFYYRHITTFHDAKGAVSHAIARDYPNERFKLYDCKFSYSDAGIFVVAHQWTETNWDIEHFWLGELF